jgi:hypothetical protein
MVKYPIPSDTSLHVASVRDEVLSKMDISQRAAMTFELSDNIRRLTEAGVRSRHPEYDDKTVGMAVTKLMIGDIELEP